MKEVDGITVKDDVDDLEDPELSKHLSSQIGNQMIQNIDQEKVLSKKKRFRHKKLLVALGIFIVLGTAVAIVLGTRVGRKSIYNAAGEYIGNTVNRDEESIQIMDQLKEEQKVEKEIYNYLIFGVEEIYGAKNTDTMMIASVNKVKGTIKLISLCRDSYVQIPGWRSYKLNAACAHGGVSLLMDTIELNYGVQLDGYASVNFDSFEKIIDLLGGVTIELGRREASYLRTTNYISNPAYRNVVEGINHLNGNQALGYCRVRKVPTVEGAHDDYGRTLRQRKVLSSIFDSVKSLPVSDMISTANQCMAYVTTSLTADQISDLIETVVESGMPNLETLRLPADGMFSSPIEYEGVGYPLVYDWERNKEELYNFINDIPKPTEVPEGEVSPTEAPLNPDTKN